VSKPQILLPQSAAEVLSIYFCHVFSPTFLLKAAACGGISLVLRIFESALGKPEGGPVHDGAPSGLLNFALSGEPIAKKIHLRTKVANHKMCHGTPALACPFLLQTICVWEFRIA